VIRVVADTNIYVSALNFGGVSDQILSLARRKRIDLFVSKPILEELGGVLRRKFRWPTARTTQTLAEIRVFAKEVYPTARLSVIRQDEPDNRILECAVAAGASILVTGDSHLRVLGSFMQIQIVSPRTLLDMMSP